MTAGGFFFFFLFEWHKMSSAGCCCRTKRGKASRYAVKGDLCMWWKSCLYWYIICTWCTCNSETLHTSYERGTSMSWQASILVEGVLKNSWLKSSSFLIWTQASTDTKPGQTDRQTGQASRQKRFISEFPGVKGQWVDACDDNTQIVS